MISAQREDRLLKLASVMILLTILWTGFFTWRMPILRAMHAIPEPYGHYMTLALEDWVAPDVYIDGRQVVFNNPRARLVRETTLVPAKQFLNSLPADVKYTWDSATNTVTITAEDRVIKLTVGQEYGWINEEKYRLEQLPRLIAYGSDYSYIPLKFVLEALNYSFTYNHDHHTVQIVTTLPGTGKITEPPVQVKSVSAPSAGGKEPPKAGGSVNSPPPSLPANQTPLQAATSSPPKEAQPTPPKEVKQTPPKEVKPTPPPTGEKNYANGSRYVGELRNGIREGRGVMYFADGAKYEGEYRNDSQHGRGKYTSAEGTVYEGEFRDNLPNGRGEFKMSSGVRYVGQIANGELHGQGTVYLPDGGKYVGQFKNNKISGRGTRHFPNGEKQEGRWENGNYLGK